MSKSEVRTPEGLQALLAREHRELNRLFEALPGSARWSSAERLRAVSLRSIEPLGVGLLAAALGCGSSYPPPAAPSARPSASSAEVTRFRLPLSNNLVDPAAALRCHAGCQQRDTPAGDLECLSECPGFERTAGVACAPDEVPPLAACFTARSSPIGSEPRAGSFVVAVIRGVPVMVGVAAVCASQTEPCSYAKGGLVP
jgi:hypothetical protein